MTSLYLADEVFVLSAQVEYLLERLADNPALGERPVNWAALDRDRAAEQWGLLTDWTEWLHDRYSLHERIPPCWYAHPSLKNSPLSAPPGSARISTPKHAPATGPPGTTASTAECTASTPGTAPLAPTAPTAPTCRSVTTPVTAAANAPPMRTSPHVRPTSPEIAKRTSGVRREPSCSSPRPRHSASRSDIANQRDTVTTSSSQRGLRAEMPSELPTSDFTLLTIEDLAISAPVSGTDPRNHSSWFVADSQSQAAPSVAGPAGGWCCCCGREVTR